MTSVFIPPKMPVPISCPEMSGWLVVEYSPRLGIPLEFSRGGILMPAYS